MNKWLLPLLIFFSTSVSAQMRVSKGVSLGVGDARYVNITGDTMTGQLTLSGSTFTVTAEVSAGTTTISGATYWGAANAKSTMTVAGILTLNSGLVVNSGIRYYSRTLAQLNALTPTATGESYYCSNCIDSAVCISSGTGTGAFVQISSATVHCN